MKNKNFFKCIVGMILLSFIMISSITIFMDPYFHYHKPLSFFTYYMQEERYLNDGIIKHFEYDSIITGTSMTQNFKKTQFDKLFNNNSIKIPFAGGSYKEINDNIKKALKKNKNIRHILRGLDYSSINMDSNHMRYNSYPTYLYDRNILNDYKYWLNKEIFVKGVVRNLIYTVLRKKNTSFDDYSSWRDEKFGKNIILKSYKREKKNIEIEKLSKADIEIIRENIQKNVLDIPLQYPNTKFIYFITPYSIVYWDSINQSGEILKQLEAEKIMIEMILEVPNIELYSFFNNYDLITNLDNYKDAGHYIYTINDKILDWISKKEYRLTKDNYKEYLEKNKEFYLNYDYDSIFN